MGNSGSSSKRLERKAVKDVIMDKTISEFLEDANKKNLDVHIVRAFNKSKMTMRFQVLKFLEIHEIFYLSALCKHMYTVVDPNRFQT